MACGALRIIPLSALLLAGCGNAAPSYDKEFSSDASARHPYGYADIRLGSTLEDTLNKVGRNFYSPKGVAECLMNMPQKGCTLIWNNLATPYVRKNGVPYRLHLTFDKWANLESITLSYDSLRQEVSFEECRELHNRTAAWLKKDYEGLVEEGGTIKNGEGIFPILKGNINSESGEMVSLFNADHYVAKNCGVNVSFSTVHK